MCILFFVLTSFIDKISITLTVNHSWHSYTTNDHSNLLMLTSCIIHWKLKVSLISLFTVTATCIFITEELPSTWQKLPFLVYVPCHWIFLFLCSCHLISSSSWFCSSLQNYLNVHMIRMSYLLLDNTSHCQNVWHCHISDIYTHSHHFDSDYHSVTFPGAGKLIYLACSSFLRVSIQFHGLKLRLNCFKRLCDAQCFCPSVQQFSSQSVASPVLQYISRIGFSSSL